MDTPRKRTPDYTDIAYREAVARLRYLLAESYSPHSSPAKITHIRSAKADDSGDETDASIGMSERSRSLRHHHPLPPLFRSTYYGAKRPLYTDVIPKSTLPPSTLQVPKVVENTGPITVGSKAENQPPPPELMAFIERQEDYIEQLEKESQFCREELSNLLSKVKDVISENEGLHEKEKSGLFKSVCEYLTSGGEEEEEEDDDQEEKRDKKKSPIKKKRLEGPSIVFESRISELEAQLTQTRIELRKAQEETDLLKRKYEGNEPVSVDVNLGHGVEQFRKQMETLQREKEELAENVTKLNSTISHMQEKEAKAAQKIKRSVDLVDQAQFEKTQAELEVRRLKDELERQHEKLRDLLQEQGRRVQDERSQAERRYAQQVEQLTCDLSSQWDTAGKLQLELEKQRRTENELRRELQQKCTTIEELKKELQTKIAGLQTEATQSAAERGSLEQELAAGRLAAERAEREARQEAARLQAEITALRQRLDRADADVLHSRRENLRLSEQIASLERELNLAKMMRDTEDKPGMTSPSKSREKELTSMIMNMEAKHVQTVGELESMIQSQTDLMEKLKDECRSLTQKLEESSARHKEERTALRVERAVLLSKLEQVWENFKELERRDIEHSVCNSPPTSGISFQTTPMLRAMSKAPSMALRLMSSSSSSPSIRHRSPTNPSPSLNPNMEMKCSSPSLIPNKNTDPRARISPNLNMNNLVNNMHLNPLMSLSPITHNTSKNIPLTNLSKNMTNNPITSLKQNMKQQHRMNPNQMMISNQDLEQTSSKGNSHPTMSTNLTLNNNQEDMHRHNIMISSNPLNLSSNPPNIIHSQFKESQIVTPMFQEPQQLLENNTVETKYLRLQEGPDQSLGKDQDLTKCPQSLRLVHPNQCSSSGKAAPNCHHVHPVEQLSHLGNSPAQIDSLLLMDPIPTTEPSQIMKTCSLILTPTKEIVGSNHNILQTPILNCNPNLVANLVQNHDPIPDHQVWNASDNNSNCLAHHRFKNNVMPNTRPLTLQDLATDSDSSESHDLL